MGSRPPAARCRRRSGSPSTCRSTRGCCPRRCAWARSSRCRAARSRPTPRCDPTSRPCGARGNTGPCARAVASCLPPGPERSPRRQLVEPPGVLVEDLALRLGAQVLAGRQLADVLGEVVVPVGHVARIEDDVVAEPPDPFRHRLLVALGREEELPGAQIVAGLLAAE